MLKKAMIALIGAMIATSPGAGAQSCFNVHNYQTGIDYLYCGAKAVNAVAGVAAGRIVPGGSQAYKAGNYLGHYMMTQPVPNWQVRPTQTSYYPPRYNPAPLPFQYRQYAPSYPNYGPVIYRRP